MSSGGRSSSAAVALNVQAYNPVALMAALGTSPLQVVTIGSSDSGKSYATAALVRSLSPHKTWCEVHYLIGEGSSWSDPPNGAIRLWMQQSQMWEIDENPLADVVSLYSHATRNVETKLLVVDDVSSEMSMVRGFTGVISDLFTKGRKKSIDTILLLHEVVKGQGKGMIQGSVKLIVLTQPLAEVAEENKWVPRKQRAAFEEAMMKIEEKKTMLIFTPNASRIKYIALWTPGDVAPFVVAEGRGGRPIPSIGGGGGEDGGGGGGGGGGDDAPNAAPAMGGGGGFVGRDGYERDGFVVDEAEEDDAPNVGRPAVMDR